jgi:23S rRNA pseudouridine1911/1915/1917 synthase
MSSQDPFIENSQEETEEDLIQVEILENDLKEFKRLDLFLSKKFSDLSRNFLKNLYQKGMISLDPESSYQGKIELKKMPPAGTIIQIEVPPPAPSTAIAEDIPLNILYEDEHLIIINKEAGMVVHPAPGHPTGTLVNAILYHCQNELTGVGDQKRPGIVHRLDKGTSGVMVVAKTQKCHEGLVLLFSEHNIIREYQAILVKTKMPSTGEVQSDLGRHPTNRLKMASGVRGGKWSKTYYKVLEVFNHCTLVSCTLETGRTHQIRVHMSQDLKAPLLMDPLYGNPKEHIKRLPGEISRLFKDYPHPFLHAKKLGFIHPITKEELVFETELPPLFQDILTALREYDL